VQALVYPTACKSSPRFRPWSRNFSLGDPFRSRERASPELVVLEKDSKVVDPSARPDLCFQPRHERRDNNPPEAGSQGPGPPPSAALSCVWAGGSCRGASDALRGASTLSRVRRFPTARKAASRAPESRRPVAHFPLLSRSKR